MNFEVLKQIEFQSIVLGNFFSTDCAGIITFYGKQKIFHLEFQISKSDRLDFRLNNRELKRANTYFQSDKNVIEFVLTPPSIKKISDMVTPKGIIYQISTDHDECRFQVYFSNGLTAHEIDYMKKFFMITKSLAVLEQNMLITENEPDEIIREPYQAVRTNAVNKLTLFKNQKKKAHQNDDSGEYLPLKRPRKQSFSGIISNNDPIAQQAEAPVKRTLRTRNRDEINLCEDLSEEAQLHEALKRSLKGIDPKIIDSMKMDDLKSQKEAEQVDLFENVDKTMELFTYNTTRGELIVRMEDYICLSRNEYLSDVIIDFYLHYIYNTKMTQEQRDKTFIFGTHFYTLYSLSSEYSGWNDEENAGLNAKEKRYKRIQSILNKDVNIFEKDYLIMPLMDHNHWFLAIVCFPKLNGSYTIEGNEKEVGDVSKHIPKMQQPKIKSSCILMFDSIKGNGSRRNVAITHIKNFLEYEWLNKYQNQFHFDIKHLAGHSPKVPLQLNNVDCGCFILEFFERFFVTSPIDDYRFPIDLLNWFSSEDIRSQKRREIANVVQSMIENKEIELPNLRYFGDSQNNGSDVIIIEDQNGNDGNGNDADENGNNNDENFNNNNDYYCLDSNNVTNNSRDEQKNTTQNDLPAVDDVIFNSNDLDITIIPIVLEEVKEVKEVNTQDLLELDNELFDKDMEKVIEDNMKLDPEKTDSAVEDVNRMEVNQENNNSQENAENVEGVDRMEVNQEDNKSLENAMEVDEIQPDEPSSNKEVVEEKNENCDMNENNENEPSSEQVSFNKLIAEDLNHINHSISRSSETSIVLSD